MNVFLPGTDAAPLPLPQNSCFLMDSQALLPQTHKGEQEGVVGGRRDRQKDREGILLKDQRKRDTYSCKEPSMKQYVEF